MINKFGFEELEIWKKARLLKNEISTIIKTFPSDEKFRITDQLIRSSRFVGSLVAEGHGRFSYRDQMHFCIQARGSIAGILNHFIDARDANYISEIQLNDRQKLKELERTLNGYNAYLRTKKDALP